MNAPHSILQYRGFFEASGHTHQVDAVLLAALCWRESQGGLVLSPPGPAGKGDFGHGHGLMQIDDHAHGAWLLELDVDGVPKWQKPALNIDKGAEILRGCMHAFPGELPLAVVAYNRGEDNVRHTLHALPPGATAEERFLAADAHSAGHDYGADVLAHWKRFRAAA